MCYYGFNSPGTQLEFASSHDWRFIGKKCRYQVGLTTGKCEMVYCQTILNAVRLGAHTEESLGDAHDIQFRLSATK